MPEMAGFFACCSSRRHLNCDVKHVQEMSLIKKMAPDEGSGKFYDT